LVCDGDEVCLIFDMDVACYSLRWGWGVCYLVCDGGTRLVWYLMVWDVDEACLLQNIGLHWGRSLFDISWFAMGYKACLIFSLQWGQGVWYWMVCDGDEACLIFGLQVCLIFGLRWGRGLFDILWFARGTRLVWYLFAMGMRLVWGLQWGTRLVWYLMVSDGNNMDEGCLIFDGLQWGRGLFDIWWFAMGTRLVWYLMVCAGEEVCLIFDGLRWGTRLV